MTVTPGTRLGPYEVVSPLGAGGWGEVWRARDTRLARDVAIKVLPVALAENERFVARFEREARAISSLNHPNICTLYDVGHEGATRFIVMELIEGETLAQRLEKGPLPPDQVLRLGGQIASALDKAHGQGIIHRDLKPSNVMLTRTGVKLVDFGVAHIHADSPLLDSISQEETEAVPLTAEGSIVGTYQYMAPEQIEGKEPDARTDIFALGVVLYEMVTGRRAFSGESKASLIGSIMSAPVRPISSFVPMTPPALEHVVRRCLEKHPDDRWQSARDIARQLEWISDSDSQPGLAALPPRLHKRPMFVALLVVALLAAIITAFLLLRPRIETSHAATISRLLPPQATEFDFTEGNSGSLAISPDGRMLALTAREENGTRALWIQSLDSAEPRRLSGTEGARFPFWSPDGRFVAFFADGKLKQIEISGAAPIVLCDALNGRSGTWNRKGVILFSAEGTKPISRVSDAGGPSTEVTSIDAAKGETTHRWASFLPDGDHFLYFAGTHTLGNHSDYNAVYVTSLSNPSEQKLVLKARSNTVYASGHLLYVRDDVLVAQPFDLDLLETTGNPVPLPESVRYCVPWFRGVFAASDDVVVYQPGVANPNAQLAWLDRSGNILGELGREARVRGRPAISPDGAYAVASIEDESSGMRDIWLFDVVRNSQTRFTFGPRSENTPIWSPDGKFIAYHEQDAENPNASLLMMRDARGSEEARLVTSDPSILYPTSWSRDGRLIIATRQTPAGDWDLVTIDVTEENPSVEPLLARKQSDSFGVPSPDGAWLAHYSDDSGRIELWASLLSGGGGKWQLTTSGLVMIGSEWRQGEVLYSRDDGGIYALPVSIDGSTLKPGTASLVFKNPRVLSWTASADGERILAAMNADDKTNAPLMIIQNWSSLVRNR